MLPTFIIIGAMKSGTTSMYRHLSEHPQICMSKPKELNFFVQERNFDKGLRWYQDRFEADGAKAYGEASPGYTKYPTFDGVPERMHRILPDVKLIYLLRDPIERLLSHHTHGYINGWEKEPDVSKALRPIEDSPYVACSKYGMQLSRYLDYYPLDQILVLTLDELRQQPSQTIKQVFQFIGVDDGFVPEDPSAVHHRTANKAKHSALGRRISNPKLRKLLRLVLPASLTRSVPGGGSPVLEEDLRAQLIEYLEDDLRVLRNLTGRDFAEWQLA